MALITVQSISQYVLVEVRSVLAIVLFLPLKYYVGDVLCHILAIYADVWQLSFFAMIYIVIGYNLGQICGSVQLFA